MKPRTVIPFSHLFSRRIVPVIGATCSRYLTAVTLESDISPPYYGIASGNSSGIRLTLILFGKLARDDNSGRIVTRQGGWKLANFFLFFFIATRIPTITPEMIIPRFTAFLQLGEKVDAPFNTRIGPREQREVAGVHTRASTHPPRYISHRRTSLYVNCIRNSEYPANFLRADHLRISAKRTSIRRSLHHKFRRTCVTPTSEVTSH